MAKQVPALRGRVDYRCKLSVRNLDPPENAYHASVAMRKSEFELRRCSHGDTNDCNSPSALTVYSDCARAENNGRSASLRHRSAKSVDLVRWNEQWAKAATAACAAKSCGGEREALTGSWDDMGTDRRGAPVGNMEPRSDRDTAGSHQPRGSR